MNNISNVTKIDEASFHSDQHQIASLLAATSSLIRDPHQSTDIIRRQLAAVVNGRLLVGYSVGIPVLVVAVEPVEIEGRQHWRTVGARDGVKAPVRTAMSLSLLLDGTGVDLIRQTLLDRPGSRRRWSRPAGLLMHSVPRWQWGPRGSQVKDADSGIIRQYRFQDGSVDVAVPISGCPTTAIRALSCDSGYAVYSGLSQTMRTA